MTFAMDTLDRTFQAWRKRRGKVKDAITFRVKVSGEKKGKRISQTYRVSTTSRQTAGETATTSFKKDYPGAVIKSVVPEMDRGYDSVKDAALDTYEIKRVSSTEWRIMKNGAPYNGLLESEAAAQKVKARLEGTSKDAAADPSRYQFQSMVRTKIQEAERELAEAQMAARQLPDSPWILGKVREARRKLQQLKESGDRRPSILDRAYARWRKWRAGDADIFKDPKAYAKELLGSFSTSQSAIAALSEARREYPHVPESFWKAVERVISGKSAGDTENTKPRVNWAELIRQTEALLDDAKKGAGHPTSGPMAEKLIKQLESKLARLKEGQRQFGNDCVMDGPISAWLERHGLHLFGGPEYLEDRAMDTAAKMLRGVFDAWRKKHGKVGDAKPSSMEWKVMRQGDEWHVIVPGSGPTSMRTLVVEVSEAPTKEEAMALALKRFSGDSGRRTKDYITESGGKFTVHSEKGKSLGTYPSRAAAEKRLRQVEYFKGSDAARFYIEKNISGRWLMAAGRQANSGFASREEAETEIERRVAREPGTKYRVVSTGSRALDRVFDAWRRRTADSSL